MKRMSFFDHLDELRATLFSIFAVWLVSTLIGFYFRKSLLAFLLGSLEMQPVLLGPLDGFLISWRVAFFAGVTLTSPLWLTLCFRFIAPALLDREKRFVIPIGLIFFLLLASSLLLATKVSLPALFRLLSHFNASIGQDLWTLSKTLSFVISILLAHVFVFQLYFGILFLIHFRLLTYSFLLKNGRMAIVALFLLSALVTPPDVTSQLLAASFLLLLSLPLLFYAKVRDQTSLQEQFE